MFSTTFSNALRYYWTNGRFNYSLRVFIALIGIILPCWYLKQTAAITPLVLGIIAGALAETDTNLKAKSKALLVTLTCFAIAAFSIEILFPYPWLFALGLGASTVIFILLGAMGSRYQPIAFSSLLLAVYTMLDAKNSTNMWQQPMLLLGGAAWFGVLSLVWRYRWPRLSLQQNIANVFSTLHQFFETKSQLFYPLGSYDVKPLRLQSVQRNTEVVNALNNAKRSLLQYNTGRERTFSNRYLTLYFVAQDVHERINASHYLYHELAKTFQYNDVLFRFERLLQEQARVCERIAEKLAKGEPYRHQHHSVHRLDELRLSIQHLETQSHPAWREPLRQLHFLYQNLAKIEQLLSQVSQADISAYSQERELRDDDPKGFAGRWQRVKQHCQLSSPLMRHAIRLSIALVGGYAIIQGLEMERGYWILLTTLFVCQQSYSATRIRLKERVGGTLGGLLAGIPMLLLLPSIEGQLVMMVISGVLFFYYRQHNYALATFYITLLVMLCFNQIGEGFAVVLPRLYDTLTGCLLAVLVVTFILPDWQSKRLKPIMASTITAHRDYLAQIIVQYRLGKNDSLAYRVSRRDAHNQDVALNTVISNMLKEPERHQIDIEACYRFMSLSNALLSYISAIGAHRAQLDEEQIHQLVAQTHRTIHYQLTALSQRLNGEKVDVSQCIETFDDALKQWQESDNMVASLIVQQLRLIQAIFPEMFSLVDNLKR
ncbi:YccS family putative transporter [Thaumasiovibrio subtropicus]|uniref:YccS family putative transporter n=1 Tax=Thaumasiovibrio subtropicus TaxID=1891207 RepID=UPI000B3628F2|nr:YccS family putative transporter [Thaumasiovibrio subtropicus]